MFTRVRLAGLVQLAVIATVAWSLTCGGSIADEPTKPADAPKPEAQAPAAPAAPAAAEKPAADNKPAADAKLTDSKPAATTKPAGQSAPATEKPAAASPAAEAKLTALVDEWREIKKQLEQLQIDYKETIPKDRQPLRKKFDEALSRGDQVEKQLFAAANEVFREGQGTSTLATDYLVSAAVRFSNHDQYERALEIAQGIIAVKVNNPRIYTLAGTAAFQLNQYDLAEKFFQQADDEGVLDGTARELKNSLKETKEKWIAEQSLRDLEAKTNDLPRVELDTTRGKVVVELFENQAPQTVANFISLVEKGFYNGLTFHRVLPGFVVQGGDPEGTGRGGPGYTIRCETDKADHRLHFRGSLSMAHAGKDTGGSQFFICLARTPQTASLDGKHTVFGRVLEGMGNVAAITHRNPERSSFGEQLPTPDKIISAKVLRKRDHAYEPTKVE